MTTIQDLDDKGPWAVVYINARTGDVEGLFATNEPPIEEEEPNCDLGDYGKYNAVFIGSCPVTTEALPIGKILMKTAKFLMHRDEKVDKIDKVVTKSVCRFVLTTSGWRKICRN